MRKLELFTLLHLQASKSETLSIFHSFTSLSSDSTLLAFFNQRHIKLHILIHYSQVIFRGRSSRQLRFGTRSSLKHLTKRAKPPKESVCSKARETRPGKQDFNLLWKNNSGAHQKFPCKTSHRYRKEAVVELQASWFKTLDAGHF